MRDWISSGDSFFYHQLGLGFIVVTILDLVLAALVCILATLLSFTVKLAGTGGVASAEFEALLLEMDALFWLGLLRVQQEFHVVFLSDPAARCFCCTPTGGVQLGGGR